MKQFCLLTAIFFFVPFLSQAKVINKSELPWIGALADHGVHEFNVCGNSEIQLTRKSLSKNFLVGSDKSGYLFSNMLSYQNYLKLLSDKKLTEAKTELEKEFNKARLWRYTSETGFENLGAPSKVVSRFTASIKDCMEGARTTLGNDCSRYEGAGRRGCCGEKFTGPEISWGDDKEYRLLYSPDPSIRLKVVGEKKHRYCNIQETISLQQADRRQ